MEAEKTYADTDVSLQYGGRVHSDDGQAHEEISRLPWTVDGDEENCGCFPYHKKDSFGYHLWYGLEVERGGRKVLLETAMGTELDSLNNDNHPYASAVTEMGAVSTKYSFTPYLW